MQRHKFIIVVLSILVLINFSCFLEAAVRVEPARIILTSKLGAQNTGVIEVVNNGEKEAMLQAFLYDWSLDDKDGLKTYQAGTLDTTLNNYIKFNPRSFIIEPGKKQLVRFTISTPEDLDKELRGIVFFEQEIQAPQDGSGALVKTQIGSVIYLVPEYVEYNFRINEVRFATIESPQRCLIIVENMGKAHLRFNINYKIIDSTNQLIEEDTLDTNVLLPDYERGLAFNFNNEMKPGDYKLLLTFNFINDKKSAEYEIPFQIK